MSSGRLYATKRPMALSVRLAPATAASTVPPASPTSSTRAAVVPHRRLSWGFIANHTTAMDRLSSPEPRSCMALPPAPGVGTASDRVAPARAGGRSAARRWAGRVEEPVDDPLRGLELETGQLQPL